jgi:hypothetical protein
MGQVCSQQGSLFETGQVRARSRKPHAMADDHSGSSSDNEEYEGMFILGVDGSFRGEGTVPSVTQVVSSSYFSVFLLTITWTPIL